MQNAKPNSKLKNTYLIFLFLYLLTLAIGSLPAIPLPNNQRLFVVSSGSMAPALPIGSVVIAKPQVEYHVGDIITFINADKSAGERETTTHRLEKIIDQNEETVYMTKGDSNVFSDDKFILTSQVIGRVDRQFAGLGYIINIIKSRLGLVLLIFIPGALIIDKEIKNIITALRIHKKQAQNSKDKEK